MASVRFLHTMIRVRDLDASIKFYRDIIGMKLLSRNDYPGGKFTLAFLGFGDTKDATTIELTHNWGKEEPYEIGTGFGHIAIGVDDVYKFCEKLVKAGVDVPRKPGPMTGGSTILAFAVDPDGYKIEILEA